MNISAEWIINKAKKRIYAITHAKVVVRGKSTVDADLTAIENRLTAIEENGVPGSGSGVAINLAKALAVGEVTILTSGWEADENGYHLDITNSSITASVIPVMVVNPNSYDSAKECGLKGYCQSFDGYVRILSDSVPKSAITASFALIGQRDETDISGLPMASEDTAGLVKIGEGFVSDDGVISVDKDVVITKDNIADDDEATQKLINILNG